MKDKNVIVVAVGLILMFAIAVWVIRADNQYANLLAKQINTTDSLIFQQNQAVIKKLVVKLAAKEKEVNDLKMALADIKAKAESVKMEPAAAGQAVKTPSKKA